MQLYARQLFAESLFTVCITVYVHRMYLHELTYWEHLSDTDKHYFIQFNHLKLIKFHYVMRKSSKVIKYTNVHITLFEQIITKCIVFSVAL